MIFQKSRLALLGIAALGLILISIGFYSASEPEHETLVLGVLPDTTEDIIRAKYRPLIDYLSQYLNKKVSLYISEDYQTGSV